MRGAGEETLELPGSEDLGAISRLLFILRGRELESQAKPRKKPVTRTGFFLGAGEETLTLDLFLGKEAL